MSEFQNLITTGISYTSADILKLVSEGWHINYSKGHMAAWRVIASLPLEQPQKEEKE